MNSESGVSLIITFFIMLIILAVVLSIGVILYNEIKIIRNVGDSVVAFYIADSGVEKTLYYDRKNTQDNNHGICGICNACPDCTPCNVPNTDTCKPETCTNCTVTFNSNLPNELEKSYLVTATVAPSDDPTIFNVGIDSVGSYTHATGANAVKRAIHLDTNGTEIPEPPPPPPPLLTVLVVPSDPPVYTNSTVTFFANATPTDSGNYNYTWAGDCTGSGATCKTSFASTGNYTATVTVTDPGTSQHASNSATVTVTTRPWLCGDDFVDTRDNKTYKTVQIGTQCWMAENLNVGTYMAANPNRPHGAPSQGSNCYRINKFCYNNNTLNCDTYGGLYQWDQTTCNGILGTEGICPSGWRVPSSVDWDALTQLNGLLAGEYIVTGDGVTFGFLGSFNDLGVSSWFWSSTTYGDPAAYSYFLDSSFKIHKSTNDRKDDAFSVRCIKN